MTRELKNVYVEDGYSIGGMDEGNGGISDYLDFIYDKDMYYGMNTFEEAESLMLSDSIKNVLKRNSYTDSDIDYLILSDLENQICSSNYSARNYKIPYLGIYNACASLGEGFIIGSNIIEGKMGKRIIVGVSSHNSVAERQFRNPVEYGMIKKITSTYTATGGVSFILSNKKSLVRVKYITPGIVIDSGIKDVNNMGGVMAIGAADTIIKHFNDIKKDSKYYDLILTGDLGVYGKEILIKYLHINGIDLGDNYFDCGELLYDLVSQDVKAGGSGPVCSALVVSSYILKEMEKGRIKRVLVVTTGALYNSTKVFQGESIPCIGHAFSLEMVN